jgi:hypothetical protein
MRKIEKELVALIDKRLAQNGLAQDILQKGDKKRARALLVLVAQCLVGIRERGGNNKGYEVELIQKTIGGAVREPWCMSFVQSCVAYVEVKLGVKSPLPVSEGCAQVWAAAPASLKVKAVPGPGAVIIWGKYNSKGNYLGGHTGIVESFSGATMYAFEGNTEGGIGKTSEVVRDGGGVYHTKRGAKGNGAMKVRGFLIPFPK